MSVHRLWNAYMDWYCRQSIATKILTPSVAGLVLGTLYSTLVVHLVPTDLQWVAWLALIIGLGWIGIAINLAQRREYRRISAEFERRLRELNGGS